MANPHDSSEDIPDSIRFSEDDWQRLRAEYPTDRPISESGGASAEKNGTSNQSLIKLMKTDLKTAAEDIKAILPCLPEKERERFIREFGEML
ncbi:MAG: hypothetical protein AAFO06_19615 [Cyanobacteria bacterium J06597_16]